MKKLLTRDEILNADDLGGEVVEVPEWGGAVRIAAMSVASANSIFAKDVADVDPKVRLLAACLVDEGGAPIFTRKELGELLGKSAAVIKRLWQKAVEINELTLKVEDSKDPASDQGADSSA